MDGRYGGGTFLDSRIDMGRANVGYDIMTKCGGVQGNLDPAILYATDPLGDLY
jgi:hypothetical protein